MFSVVCVIMFLWNKKKRFFNLSYYVLFYTSTWYVNTSRENNNTRIFSNVLCSVGANLMCCTQKNINKSTGNQTRDIKSSRNINCVHEELSEQNSNLYSARYFLNRWVLSRIWSLQMWTCKRKGHLLNFFFCLISGTVGKATQSDQIDQLCNKASVAHTSMLGQGWENNSSTVWWSFNQCKLKLAASEAHRGRM